ncbi:MAG: EcsC family protein [Hornefia sp.]|nr:EcsC family protein [Hornefia sp.]
MQTTPWQKEWNRMQRREYAFLHKGRFQKPSKLTALLESKVPDSMQDKLNRGFAKAFELIFEKGTGIIEKTYDKESIRERFEDYEETAKIKGDRDSLKQFSKNAESSGNANLLFSGSAGIGMGIAGIGIPDIVIFTGSMLKGIYQVALNFGYSYDTPEEKFFILKIIEVSLSKGKTLDQGNTHLNEVIENGVMLPGGYEQKQQIAISSEAISSELLYTKFLQTIPIVGAVGGAYDAVYMKKILKYAEIKYHRRFLTDRAI